MKRSVWLLMLGVLAACSDAQSVTNVPEEDVGIRARFALVQVNGQALPVESPWGIGYLDEGGRVWELFSMTITLANDGHFTVVTRHREVGGRRQSSEVYGGRYELVDSTAVQFTVDGAKSSAIVTESGLNWAVGDLVLTYERVPS